MNVIAWLEWELAFYDVPLQLINHYIMRTHNQKTWTYDWNEWKVVCLFRTLVILDFCCKLGITMTLLGRESGVVFPLSSAPFELRFVLLSEWFSTTRACEPKHSHQFTHRLEENRIYETWVQTALDRIWTNFIFNTDYHNSTQDFKI